MVISHDVVLKIEIDVITGSMHINESIGQSRLFDRWRWIFDDYFWSDVIAEGYYTG